MKGEIKLKFQRNIAICIVVSLIITGGGVILMQKVKAPINESDIAIQIAVNALKHHFVENPDIFDNMEFEAREENGIWVVENILLPNEENILSCGGGFVVHIQKNDGNVLKIELYD